MDTLEQALRLNTMLLADVATLCREAATLDAEFEPRRFRDFRLRARCLRELSAVTANMIEAGVFLREMRGGVIADASR